MPNIGKVGNNILYAISNQLIWLLNVTVDAESLRLVNTSCLLQSIVAAAVTEGVASAAIAVWFSPTPIKLGISIRPCLKVGALSVLIGEHAKPGEMNLPRR